MQSTLTYYNIVPALFSFFFKDLNALPDVLFTIAYYPILPIQTFVWRFPNFSEKLRYCRIVINMPLWSTHEIELIIREIEEMHWFWNMFNPKYKDRIKESDAWKEVSKVLNWDKLSLII